MHLQSAKCFGIVAPMSNKTSAKTKTRKRIAILIPSDCKAHRDRIAGILRYFASHPYLEAVLTGDHVANHRLSDIATAAGCSPRILQRRFQEVLDKAPIDELRERRLEHVCEMLSKTWPRTGCRVCQPRR